MMAVALGFLSIRMMPQVEAQEVVDLEGPCPLPCL